jgi:hypothetical protein
MRLEDIFIVGGGIFQDRSYELIPNIKNVYPYVDAMVLVNGGDTEGWIDKVKELDVENKIHIVDFPWCDNFPLSRQQYLEKAKEIVPQEKVLYFCRFDSDEFLSESFLTRMRKFIKVADQEQCDMLGINSYDYTVDRERKVVSKHIGDFHKGLVYRVYPTLQYVAGGHGFVHEGYNHNFRMWKVPSQKTEWEDKDWICYRHIKTQGDVWLRAQRNFFIAGGGPNLGTKQVLWQPFRKLLDEIKPDYFHTYHDYINYLKEGNVDQRLKNWFIQHMYEGEKNKPAEYQRYMLDNGIIYTTDVQEMWSGTEKSLGFGYDGASEIKEGFRYYYEWLHRDELLSDFPLEFIKIMPINNETKKWCVCEKV